MGNSAARLVTTCVLCSLFAAATVTGCGRREPVRGPNVIVVVIDTLRDDRVGVSRSGGSLTPFLDELGWRGTRFTHAYATSSWTNPSVASLFTSRYPSQHLVRGFESTLGAGEVTLAERLAGAGWVTAGFSANPQLPSQHGWSQGFAHWRTFSSFKLRAPELRAACREWLDAERERRAGAPLFLYLQFMEPHAPYEPPSGVRARVAPAVSEDSMRRVNELLVTFRWADLTATDVGMLSSLYDGEVAAIDAELRTLFAELGARGLLDDALVVVTSDHGEEFREHDLFAHGFTLYDQAIRVPLLVVGGPFAAGAVVESNVSLVDVAPTLLGLAGLPPEPRFEGQSLLPALYGVAPARSTLAELLSWQEQDWRQHEAAYIDRSMKLLVPPEHLRLVRHDIVFDLARDPLEAYPDPPGTAVDGVLLRTALEDELRQLVARQLPAERERELTPEQRERLRALGYVQ